ncbi:hypothetical protein BJX99DRAFT_226549 [Aspergillus californicus]
MHYQPRQWTLVAQGIRFVLAWLAGWLVMRPAPVLRTTRQGIGYLWDLVELRKTLCVLAFRENALRQRYK